MATDTGAMNRRQGSTEGDGGKGLPLFLLGTLICLAAPMIYMAQLNAKQLAAPWSVLAASLAGLVCLALSFKRRRSALRYGAFVLLSLFVGFQWYFVFVFAAVPAYAGPASPGHRFPPFSTQLADGRELTNIELEKNVPAVVVFFRGRW